MLTLHTPSHFTHPHTPHTHTLSHLTYFTQLHRTEWLSLKQIFKEMQKTQMKQLKDTIKSTPAKAVQERGYVGECLVKVECQEGTTGDQLRVSGCGT